MKNYKIDCKRAEQLADLILSHSLDLQSDDRLIIWAEPKYRAYANIIGRKARDLGADVRYDTVWLDPEFRKGLLTRYDKDEWKEEVERKVDIMMWATASANVFCSSNPEWARGIKDTEIRNAELNEIHKPYRDAFYRTDPDGKEVVKWNATCFPGPRDATDAGMTCKEYDDFVYDATIGSDWKKMREEMEIIKAIFNKAENVRIFVPGLTNLEFSLHGRGGKICDGRINMPDGEVYYSPVEDTVNGYIQFQYPSRIGGTGQVEDIHLKLKNGVASASSRTNERILLERMKLDKGFQRFGEFGIGCNRNIHKFIDNLLFDEKMDGTVHFALGRSLGDNLEEGGGRNKSNSHYDFICDLRKRQNQKQFPGGEIWVDGELVQKDGKWVAF